MSSANFGHTRGDTAPERITMRDVEEAACACGFQPWMMDDRMIVGFTNHSTLVTIENVDIPLVVFNSRLRAPLGISSVEKLAHVIAQWNQERINPALYWTVDDVGWQWLHIRTTIPVGTGLTEDQLYIGTKTSIELAMIASNFLVEQFAELDVSELAADVRVWEDQLRLGPAGIGVSGWTHQQLLDQPGQGPHDASSILQELDNIENDMRLVTYSPPEPEDSDSDIADMDIPDVVTIDDIVEQLDNLGIREVATHEQAVGTSINEIPFGFILDNGPSLMIRGMWYANRNKERDFLHTELLCNDYTSKYPMAKVFVSPDLDGLQVAVEAVTEIPAGMTGRQLIHCLAGGINEVLRTLDELTQEATGESVVRWG